MDYLYTRCLSSDVQHNLTKRSQDGWRVHTFNRNPASDAIDILFERETRR